MSAIGGKADIRFCAANVRFLPKMDIERRIDLSYRAAKALDMLHDGRQRVRVSVPMPFPKPDIDLALHEMKLSQ